MTDTTEPQLTLGQMLKQHEKVDDVTLTPSTYAVIRVDGKSFHNYTRALQRPYDGKFMADMDATAMYLCENISTARFAYVQSDEISLLLTDWNTQEPETHTQAWFGGKVKKMVSVSASMSSTALNFHRPPKTLTDAAVFDSRVFTLPDRDTAEKYFLWRYYDAQKNSVSMMANNLFSPSQLDGVNMEGRIAMAAKKNVHWDEMPKAFRFGRLVTQKSVPYVSEFFNKATQKQESVISTRKFWFSEPAEGMKARLAKLVPDLIER